MPLEKHYTSVGRADVAKEFLRDDGDRPTDISQVGADARAGERFGGGVPAVFRGVDDERGEFDGRITRRRPDFSGAYHPAGHETKQERRST